MCLSKIKPGTGTLDRHTSLPPMCLFTIKPVNVEGQEGVAPEGAALLGFLHNRQFTLV